MDRDYDYLIETVDYNTFTRWEEVNLVIYAFTDLGMKVAINNRYTGMVYKIRSMILTRRDKKLRVILLGFAKMAGLMYPSNLKKAGMFIQPSIRFSTI